MDEIHDFHIWSLSTGKLSMSAHMRSQNPNDALKKATEILRDKYQIFHTTIQVEKYHPGAVLGCCDNDHDDHDHPSDYLENRMSKLITPKFDNTKETKDHKDEHHHDHKHEHHDKHDHEHGHKHVHGHEHNHEHGYGH